MEANPNPVHVIVKIVGISLSLVPLIATLIAMVVTIAMYDAGGGFAIIGLFAFIPLLILSAIITTIITLINRGFAIIYFIAYSSLLGFACIGVLGLYQSINARTNVGNFIIPTKMDFNSFIEVLSWFELPILVVWLISLGLYRRARKHSALEPNAIEQAG
jgi:hypothetical protein